MNDETFEKVIARIESLQTAYAETRQNWRWKAINESEDALLPLATLAGVASEDFKRLLDFVEALRPRPEKPWLAARPGEIWEITINGETRYAGMDIDGDFTSYFDGYWGQLATNRHSSTITAGHRVLEAL